jgi:ribosomal protein S18 acetylase RimI-like enzyme
MSMERVLMFRESAASLPRGEKGIDRFRIERWGEHYHDPAANLIVLAYDQHGDSQINDQYRTLAGARKFINDIVFQPGCGDFSRQASFVAFDRTTGWMAGIVMASLVAPAVAHISQLCLAPHVRGEGLGYQLLRKAVEALRSAGVRRIGMTVTSDNRTAIELYRRCGFVESRRFHAYVWESLL